MDSDIQDILSATELLEKFNALSPSHKREYLDWITSAKKAENTAQSNHEDDRYATTEIETTFCYYVAMTRDTTLFQYCQKLIVLSEDRQHVLLAKRKGEADYDGTYSFIGGKMETTDDTLLAGMQREKNEEIGSDTIIKVLPNETYNLLFRKKDGNSMVLPHVAGLYVSGEVHLSDEYSEYQWVALSDLDDFKPKIANIPELTRWAAEKLSSPYVKLVQI